MMHTVAHSYIDFESSQMTGAVDPLTCQLLASAAQAGPVLAYSVRVDWT